MIYITGDTHGLIDFKKLEYFKSIYVSDKDILIILGDAGIIFSNATAKEYIFKYQLLGLTILFIDGNHENFALLNTFKTVKIYNALAHQISKSIYHIKRGEILIINNQSFLCMGGAISIDRRYRTLNENYFLEEIISDDDLKNAFNNLAKFDFKVDYVLTHCIDNKILQKYFRYQIDECSTALSYLDSLITYKKWYFGHYHVDEIINDKKICFYQSILNIGYSFPKAFKKLSSNFYKKYDNNDSLLCETNNQDILYGKKKITNLKVSDLPEYYIPIYNNQSTFYFNIRKIKEILYLPRMFINRFLRDDFLYFTFDLPIKIYKEDSFFQIEANHFVNGQDIIKIIKALEKYTTFDVSPYKLLINYKANFYNRNVDEFNYKVNIPFLVDMGFYKIIEQIFDEIIKKLNYADINYFFASNVTFKILNKKTHYYKKKIENLIDLYTKEINQIERGKYERNYH